MPGIPVQFSWGSLSAGYCFQGLDQYKNDIFNLLVGTVAGNFSGVVIGPNIPVVTLNGNLWIKTDALGNPIGQFLFGASGKWQWPNPRPPGGNERVLWVGTEDANGLWSYDGGDGNNPITNPIGQGEVSGAMWQVDHNFDFKIPMGSGTNSVTYNGNAATVLNQGATLGEEQHTLALPENTPHRHAFAKTNGAASDHGFAGETGGTVTPGTPAYIPGGSGDVMPPYDVADINAFVGRVLQTDNPILTTIGTTTTNAHNTLPPVLGVFVIRRTNRIYYTAS